MADKNVIIIDETVDEAIELTPEEIEEKLRNERLKKHYRKNKKYNNSLWNNISKCVNVVGILGIMIGMLLENGLIAAISLAVIFVSSIVNYVFFK